MTIKYWILLQIFTWRNVFCLLSTKCPVQFAIRCWYGRSSKEKKTSKNSFVCYHDVCQLQNKKKSKFSVNLNIWRTFYERKNSSMSLPNFIFCLFVLSELSVSINRISVNHIQVFVLLKSNSANSTDFLVHFFSCCQIPER